MLSPLTHVLIGTFCIMASLVLAFEVGLLGKEHLGARTQWVLRIGAIAASGIGFINIMAATLKVDGVTALIILVVALIAFIGLEQVVERTTRRWWSRRSER